MAGRNRHRNRHLCWSGHLPELVRIQLEYGNEPSLASRVIETPWWVLVMGAESERQKNKTKRLGDLKTPPPPCSRPSRGEPASATAPSPDVLSRTCATPPTSSCTPAANLLPPPCHQHIHLKLDTQVKVVGSHHSASILLTIEGGCVGE